VTEYKKKVQVL